MKSIFFVGLLALSLFLVACGPNLPPEPGAPGTVAGSAIAGRAFTGTDVAATFAVDAPPRIADTAGNALVDNNCAVTESGGVRSVQVQVACENDQYCWNTGYYFCGAEGDEDSPWTSFSLTGIPISGSNWLDGSAVATVSVALGGNEQGCAFLGYSCSFDEQARGWDCNGNKWRIAGCQVPPPTPPVPAEPTPQEACAGTGGSWDTATSRCLPPGPSGPLVPQ